MAYLTKQQILNSVDFKFEEVAVPQWGGVVRVRNLTAKEAEDIAKAKTENQNPITKWVSIACCDEHGKALFTEQDIDALKEKSVECLVQVMHAAVRVQTNKPDGEVLKN